MPLKTYLDEPPSPNLTPMIDIVFLLIIFFMVGTKFAEMERKLAVNVPRVAEGGTLAPATEKHVVTVRRDGRVSLDRRLVTLGQLTAELAAARRRHPALGVIVRGDAESPFQNVASVLNACRRAGISEMGISVRIGKREGLLR